MRQVKWAALIALLLLAGLGQVSAQETRGSIEGTVKDASGAVLHGVTVEAKSASGATAVAVTDDRGAYRFPALPVGNYTITASLQGFSKAERSDVLLTLGQQLRADLVLTVGALTESVDVTAVTPIVDVKRNSVSTTMTNEVIDLIPKGRDFLDALTGIPGTNNVARAGGIMIDGATSTENRYVVDGIDTTSLDEGDSGKRVIIDFVDQIQVQRSGYNAEFRAATGGVISAITKSGTNRYRGEIGLNYTGPTRNRTLQGSVRPTVNVSTVDDESLDIAFPNRLHEESNFEPVLQFSGPIFKDRMWFFAGIAPERETLTREVTWRDPNPAGQTQTFKDEERNDQYNYTVTSQLSGNTRLRFNGSHGRSDPGLTVPTIDTGTGISTQNPLNFNPQPTLRTFSSSDTYSGSFDWTATEKTFVNVTTGWYQTDAYSDGGDQFKGTRRTFANSSLTYADVPAAFRRGTNFADNPVNTFNAEDAFNRLNLNADLTTYRRWKGEHSLKIGAQYEKLGNRVNNGQQHLNIALNWNRPYQPAAGGAPVRGTYGYYIASRQYTSGDVTSHNVGLFVQDQWSVNNRLTLNMGLRTDRTHIPSYRPENPSLDFTFGEKIAPRIGAAYDMRGDGRWKLYGSWGVFYDIEKLEMPRGLWGADHWVQYVYTLDTFDWQNIDCADVNGETGCPGTLIERFDRRHVSNEISNLLVDPNLKPMRAQEATIGMDHELGRYSSIGLRYTHKWLDKAIEDVGVIDPVIGAEIFYIANPGEGIGEFQLGTQYPPTPIAKRVYDGFDISFNRRLHNNWSLNTSVLVSRLWGNYTGLSNGQSESGRQSPNVTRAFDGLFMSYDSKGQATYGRMGTDIPFQFKALATYVMPWGTSVGVDQRVQSGLLQTTSINYQSVPVPVFGYGDLGRTPMFSQTNLLLGHTFNLPGNTRFNVQLNIENLFDQDTVLIWDTTPYLNGSLTFPNERRPDGSSDFSEFFAGFDPVAIMAALNARTPTLGNRDPRYGTDFGVGNNSYQSPRAVRLYARFAF